MIVFRLKEAEFTLGSLAIRPLKLTVQSDEISSGYNICKIILLRTLSGHLESYINRGISCDEI